MFSEEIIARFHNLTNRDGDCWQWLGKPDKNGYGRLRIGGRKTCKAHRAAWIIANNADPGDKLICHHCDNPGCVNPAHLYLGTFLENNRDRARRGRSNPEKGGDRWNAKLTDKTALAILAEYKGGITAQHELAAKFGVAQSNISHILAGKTWKHVRAKFSGEIVMKMKPRPKILSEAKEMEIVVRYSAGGVSQDKLGKEYGVSQRTISLIVIRNR